MKRTPRGLLPLVEAAHRASACVWRAHGAAYAYVSSPSIGLAQCTRYDHEQSQCYREMLLSWWVVSRALCC